MMDSAPALGEDAKRLAVLEDEQLKKINHDVGVHHEHI